MVVAPQKVSRVGRRRHQSHALLTASRALSLSLCFLSLATSPSLPAPFHSPPLPLSLPPFTHHLSLSPCLSLYHSHHLSLSPSLPASPSPTLTTSSRWCLCKPRNGRCKSQRPVGGGASSWGGPGQWTTSVCFCRARGCLEGHSRPWGCVRRRGTRPRGWGRGGW